VVAEHAECANERRILDCDDVAWIEEDATDRIDGVGRAVSQRHSGRVGIDPTVARPLGDELFEFVCVVVGAVLEDCWPVLLEYALDGGGEFGFGEQIRGGRAETQRHRVCVCDRAPGAVRRAVDGIADPRRKQRLDSSE
jgi:hypothetical protein